MRVYQEKAESACNGLANITPKHGKEYDTEETEPLDNKTKKNKRIFPVAVNVRHFATYL